MDPLLYYESRDVERVDTWLLRWWRSVISRLLLLILSGILIGAALSVYPFDDRTIAMADRFMQLSAGRADVLSFGLAMMSSLPVYVGVRPGRILKRLAIPFAVLSTLGLIAALLILTEQV